MPGLIFQVTSMLSPLATASPLSGVGTSDARAGTYLMSWAVSTSASSDGADASMSALADA